FPAIQGDYAQGDFTAADLAGYDAIVFAAGNDPRHLTAGTDAEEFWQRTQSEGIPRFAELAKEAGVGRFVHVCSYYHHAMPELAVSNAYVAARKAADERVRALADATFNASTLNPPS